MERVCLLFFSVLAMFLCLCDCLLCEWRGLRTGEGIAVCKLKL